MEGGGALDGQGLLSRRRTGVVPVPHQPVDGSKIEEVRESGGQPEKAAINELYLQIEDPPGDRTPEYEKSTVNHPTGKGMTTTPIVVRYGKVHSNSDDGDGFGNPLREALEKRAKEKRCESKEVLWVADLPGFGDEADGKARREGQIQRALADVDVILVPRQVEAVVGVEDAALEHTRNMLSDFRARRAYHLAQEQCRRGHGFVKQVRRAKRLGARIDVNNAKLMMTTYEALLTTEPQSIQVNECDQPFPIPEALKDAVIAYHLDYKEVTENLRDSDAFGRVMGGERPRKVGGRVLSEVMKSAKGVIAKVKTTTKRNRRPWSLLKGKTFVELENQLDKVTTVLKEKMKNVAAKFRHPDDLEPSRFCSLLEAKGASPRVISSADEFVKHLVKVPDLGVPEDVCVVFDEQDNDDMSELGHYAPRRLTVSVNRSDQKVKVGASLETLKVLHRVVTENASLVSNSVKETGEDNVRGIAPVVVFTRRRHEDFVPQLHLNALHKYTRCADNDVKGSYLLLVAHESLQLDDDEEDVRVGDSTSGAAEGGASPATTGRGRTNGAKQRDAESEEVVRREVERIAKVLHCEANAVGSPDLKQIVNADLRDRVLCGELLKAPFYFQLDDDLEFREFIDERRDFASSSFSAPRALAFMQRAMYFGNHELTPDTLKERHEALAFFKAVFQDCVDKQVKVIKRLVNKLVNDHLQQIDSAAKQPEVLYRELQKVVEHSEFNPAAFRQELTDLLSDAVNQDAPPVDTSASASDPSPFVDIHSSVVWGIVQRLIPAAHSSIEDWAMQETMNPVTLLSELLGAERCGHVALGRIGSQGFDKYTARTTPPTAASVFNATEALFSKITPITAVKKMIAESKSKKRRKRKGWAADLKWKEEGLRLAREGFKYADSYFSRRLLVNGPSGLSVTCFAVVEVCVISSNDHDKSTNPSDDEDEDDRYNNIQQEDNIGL
ncbi:unnamed protein product [Durusdinium trenchii]|uniref:Uncharacterized protein n=1 Tax=Durusdinium trenchii TaxID=1381693 RepID=A0ABP0R481_9DINO